jgi:hypothetical protein
MTKADHIASVVAEKDAEIARLEAVIKARDKSLTEEITATRALAKECLTIEAATIERCAKMVESFITETRGPSGRRSYSNDHFAAAAASIRALAKPAKEPG